MALFIYADDAVICCNSEKDAERIRKALENHLTKFGLSLNQEKAGLVKFDKTDARGSGGFDFIGFTFYLGRTRADRPIPDLFSTHRTYEDEVDLMLRGFVGIFLQVRVTESTFAGIDSI